MSQIVNTTGRTAENIAAEIRTLDTQGKHLLFNSSLRYTLPYFELSYNPVKQAI